MIERNPDGTFKKGVSGNPSGRRKGVTALVRSLSNDYKDYINILDKFIRDESLSAKDRKACIAEILDRSLGKPTQRHEVRSHNINISAPDGIDIEEM